MKKAKKQKKAAKKVTKAAKKTQTVTKVATKNSLGQPYGDRILVKPQPAEEKTSFGIIIPDSGQEKPEQGIVVAVGDGKLSAEGKVIAMRVKVGDKIMFSKYGFDEVKINGHDYYLIREDSITYVFA
jgi:chaperonin GroES